MTMKPIYRYLLYLILVLLIGVGFYGKSAAQETTLLIVFGFPEENLTDRDTTGSGHKAQQLLMNSAVLPSTMPKMISEKQASEETAGEAEEEEKQKQIIEELNQVGALLSFEGFSNDTWGRSGNAYGLSATYERAMDPLKLGGVLDYRFLRFNNKYTDDFNSNRLTGVIYAAYSLLEAIVDISAGATIQSGYTINDEDIRDYGNYGGGGYITVGKDFEICEVTAGAAYMFTKYDLNEADDHSHLVKYGIILGVPLGQKLAANLYFIDTRNVTDYELNLFDSSFFTLGTEWIVSLARSWVISCGYRTILGFEDYSSHEGYFGSQLKF